LKPSPFFAAAILLLSALCGCERQSSLIAPQEPIAFRIIATMNSDAKILETANLTTGRFVTLDDEVIAEWVPVREDVKNNIGNAVTRQTQTHTEVLVLHLANDISDAEIASVKGFTDSTSRNQTLITLTDVGSRLLFSFTVEHVGQAVAVIASGEIRAIPRIVSPVRKEMVLSPDTIDKVRVVPAAVN
jgi:preprotein translocase subunit SecD